MADGRLLCPFSLCSFCMRAVLVLLNWNEKGAMFSFVVVLNENDSNATDLYTNARNHPRVRSLISV